MTNTILNRCAGCGGTLRIISLSQRERMDRRIGRAWMARCSRCQVECQVVPEAWRKFVQAQRAIKKQEQARREQERQPSLF